MAGAQYETLAGVYEWLVPEALRTPEGAVAAFADVVEALPPGARVLDCAAGTGQLAVGLALRGLHVTASDASPAMADRARELAARHAARIEVATCAWEDLPRRGSSWRFDAVFCVGNSITHAAGTAGRRAALAAMAGVLRAGAPLVLSSRNWERVRRAPRGIDVADRLERRGDALALVIRAWDIPDDWEAVHHLDVAVALLGAGDRVDTVQERLAFWPFTEEALRGDLRAAGLEVVSSTYAADVERYRVVAQASSRLR